jgi:hypothetical protein
MDYPIKSIHNLLKILIGKRSEIYYFLYETKECHILVKRSANNLGKII